MSEPRICAAEGCDEPIFGPTRKRFHERACAMRDLMRRRRSPARSSAQPDLREDLIAAGIDPDEYAIVNRAAQAEKDALEREMRRIEESGEKCGFIFGVPAPASIVSILSR